MVLEIILDSLLLYFCSMKLFREDERGKLKDTILIPIFILLCTIFRMSPEDNFGKILFTISDYGYEILPANNIFILLVLFMIITITNSLWFKADDRYTLFGTIFIFAIYGIVREIGIIILYTSSVTSEIWYSVINRILSIAFALLFMSSQPFRWIKENLKDGDLYVSLTVGNSAIILITVVAIFEFDISVILRRLPIVVGVLGVMIICDALFMFRQEKRQCERKKIASIEQYIPVIEQLICEVRARQHEYNNRLLAISSVISTADNLTEAQQEVSVLIDSLEIEANKITLLNSDSKVIGGMIYGKIKQAEMQGKKVKVEIDTKFKNSQTAEYDFIEIIGILMDNAMEASGDGDEIIIKAKTEDGKLCVLVSNPYEPLSNKQFVEMFRSGYTTKHNKSFASGHGLSNVRKIVERYHGKIITRNETIENRNYVTIGVLLP